MIDREFYNQIIMRGVLNVLPNRLRVMFLDDDGQYVKGSFWVENVKADRDEDGVMYIAADDCVFEMEPGTVITQMELRTMDGQEVARFVRTVRVEGPTLLIWWYGSIHGKDGRICTFDIGGIE